MKRRRRARARPAPPRRPPKNRRPRKRPRKKLQVQKPRRRFEEKKNVFLVFQELGCFHLSTNVTLADGSTRSLNDLQLGDEIRVFSSSNEFRTSRILTIFRHFRTSVRFVEIFVDGRDAPLRLTRSHSLFVRKKFSSTFRFDFASTIEIGDSLLSAHFDERRVTKIGATRRENELIATILTGEGTFLANELVASSYATFSHSTMHFLSAPLRLWFEWKTSFRFDELFLRSLDFQRKCA